MSKNSRLLVPESQPVMDYLRKKALDETGSKITNGYHGDMLTSQAGQIGGIIGGQMVKKMIQNFEEELANKTNGD
ncbi:small, acid-soluble spore protein, alpha/beta type [Syntrophomonas erecta]